MSDYPKDPTTGHPSWCRCEACLAADLERTPVPLTASLTADSMVEAEFRGSLTICEDGELRPTRDSLTGAVVDKFGVYRMPEDERPYQQDSGPGRWG